MALHETAFANAIEDFAAKWQDSFNEGDRRENADWDDVRVLERVCFSLC